MIEEEEHHSPPDSEEEHDPDTLHPTQNTEAPPLIDITQEETLQEQEAPSSLVGVLKEEISFVDALDLLEKEDDTDMLIEPHLFDTPEQESSENTIDLYRGSITTTGTHILGLIFRTHSRYRLTLFNSGNDQVSYRFTSGVTLNKKDYRPFNTMVLKPNRFDMCYVLTGSSGMISICIGGSKKPLVEVNLEYAPTAPKLHRHKPKSKPKHIQQKTQTEDCSCTVL